VEVGNLLQRALDSGATLEDCAKILNLTGTSQLRRFLSVRELPSDILHLVDWGRSDSSAVGFTTAVEIARVPDVEDKQAIAHAVLEQGLQTDEVRQVAQLRRRSNRPIAECLKEVIGMRRTVERRYVFIGAIDDENVRVAVSRLTQAERNALLHSGLKVLGLDSVSGRLGEQLFTVVGDERLNSRLNSEGRRIIEARLRTYIAENVVNVQRER